jgi:hypothetical protein
MANAVLQTFIPQVRLLKLKASCILNDFQDATLFSGTIRDNLDPYGKLVRHRAVTG